MRVITPLSEDQEIDWNNSYTIFLAGGCMTNWRDEFIRKVSERCKSENVVILNPFCDSKKIKLRDLLFWEREHLLNCHMIAFNFEGSDSPQPGSMFELGRYGIMKAVWGNTIVNIDDSFKLKREVEIHLEAMNIDAKEFSHSNSDEASKIEVIHSDLGRMIERCVEIIERC